VAAGDYTEAIALWQKYAARLAAAGPARHSLAEAADLIEWSRPILAAARAQAVEQLRGLHVAGVYGGGPAASTSVLVRANL
jgi:hypothetical protein